MTISITVSGVAYPSPSSAADVNWAAQQVALLQALAAHAVSPLTWTAVPSLGYGSGWTGTLEYARDAVAERTYLRGTATHSGSILSTVTTLPAALYPPADAYFLCADHNTPGTPVAVKVTTAGAIVPLAGTNAAVIDFGQVSFDTQAF